MPSTEARAADIEIIENRRDQPFNNDTPGGSMLVPDEVRINGQPVLCSGEHPVKIHEMGHGQAVLVTLTVFARSLAVRAEAR